MTTNKLLIAIGISIAAFSCKNSTEKLPNEFADATIHFIIRYPANWKFDSTNYSMREELAGGGDDFQEKIVLGYEKMPAKLDAKTYATSVATTYKLLDSQFKQIALHPYIQKDFEAYELQFSTLQNNMQYESSAYILIKDSFAFTIQCNATDKTFEAHHPIFKEIINSAKYIQ
jgi:hypothetical protein